MMSKSKKNQKNIVGPKLKQMREKMGISQRDLAAQFQLKGCDIDQNTITRIETRKRRVTDIEIQAIMDVFHVSSHTLFENDDTDDV